MTEPRTRRSKDPADALAAAVAQRLRDERPVRRSLPGGGRLHVDRPLPFLCLHRAPHDPAGTDAGTRSLVTGQASYLAAPREFQDGPGLGRLVSTIATAVQESFGSLLLLEVWSTREPDRDRIRLHAPRDPALRDFVDYTRQRLSRLRIPELPAEIDLVTRGRGVPPDLSPVLGDARAKELGVVRMGLELPPVYRDPETGAEYPELLRTLRRRLGKALHRIFHRFACGFTRRCPVNFHMMGRRAVVKAVWTVDAGLAAITEEFDFLLQVTPTNSAVAWEDFRASDFEVAPTFRYRPLPFDVVALKRRLWGVPIERVEDPTLFDLLRQKQDEIDRAINLLLDRETPRFVRGAAQLFGDVDDALLALAREILAVCPPVARDDTSGGGVDAEAFAEHARAQIDAYRGQWDGVAARVEIRPDIASGLMVSRGILLIGAETRTPVHRVEALLAHEVGTHIVTYWNGRAQRFHLLAAGLAGYDPLQEGIAVLAEHLVGGLTPGRLRLLAARVVVVAHMLAGASFVETFRELRDDHGFEERSAFSIAVRVYRGGGLTKDASYLRGLRELLAYLGRGGKFESLLVGKVAADHLPVVRELRAREVIGPPRLRPLYLDEPGAVRRLEEAARGIGVLDLLGPDGVSETSRAHG